MPLDCISPRLRCARPSLRLALLAFAAAALVGPAASGAPELYLDPGVPHANTAGDVLLRWPGELNKRYRVEASTDLVKWTTVSQVVGLGHEVRSLAKRKYVPPTADPTKPDPDVRKFWRVTPFDFDSNGNGSTDYDESRLGTDPFAGARIPLSSHFVPFGLCLSNSNWSMSAADQIKLCQDIGYTGYGLSGFGSEAGMKAFADNPEVSFGRFRIYSALWWTDLATAIDWTSVDKSLVQAARMDMAIWMVVAGSKTAANVDAAYSRLKTTAQHCQAKGAKLVLYPHQGTTFVSAEEALVLWKRLQADPEVTPAVLACTSISIHLCHELKAGNRDRIAAVVAAVAPYCTLASVNGAETDTASRGGWDTGIMPLDQGTYDVRPFLQALATAGYTGPMEYHTYNLPDPRYDDHLERTLLRWRQLVAPPTP